MAKEINMEEEMRGFLDIANVEEAVSGSSAGGSEAQALLPRESPLEKVPTYQQLSVYQGRIWPDQSDWLDDHRKMLNRARKGRGERITNNTLIRVALKVLEAHPTLLRGTTEDELAASVLEGLVKAPKSP